MTRPLREVLGWAVLRSRRGELRAASVVTGAFVAALLVAVLGGLAWNVQAMIADDVVDSGSLAVVELRTDAEDARPLTASALELVADLPEVAAVEPALDGASIYGADGGWVLTVAAYQPSQPAPGIRTPPEAGEFIAPSSAQGADFAALVGRMLEVEATTRTGTDEGTSEARTLRLVGTYDPSWQVYGPAVALTAFDTALDLVASREGMTPDAYLAERGVPSAFVVAADEARVDALAEQLRGLGFAASPLADRLGRLPSVFALLPYAVLLASAFGLVLLVISTFTGVTGVVRGQLRDLALLRVNGWSVAELRALITIETVLVGALGAVLGGAFAVVAVPAASFAIGAHLGIDPGLATLLWRPLLVSAGVVAMSVLVGSLAARAATQRSLAADPYIAVRSEGV